MRCSNASSMSRSVPGSRSAVVNAAVVCSTLNWHTPVLSPYCFHRMASSCLVISTTSRFLWVLIVSRCITHLPPRRKQFKPPPPRHRLPWLQQHHAGVCASPILVIWIRQIELWFDGDKIFLQRRIYLYCLDLR